MMHTAHNPDDFVTIVTFERCEHHKRQPWDDHYAGCTCHGGMSQRRATPEEKAENIRRRQAEEERRRQYMADYDAGLIK